MQEVTDIPCRKLWGIDIPYGKLRTIEINFSIIIIYLTSVSSPTVYALSNEFLCLLSYYIITDVFSYK